MFKNKPTSPPKPYEREQALACVDSSLDALMDSASKYREYYFGNKVELCAIINARCGKCSMDCSFCAQSVHQNATVTTFPMLEPTVIVEKILEFAKYPIKRVGIVTSGGALGNEDMQSVLKALTDVPSSLQGRICASLGKLPLEQLKTLQKHGLTRYHHNLESSENYYKNVCTTQSWQERVDTVKRAHSINLDCCSGGLFGLGEDFEQRIDFALSLRDMGIKHIPINFLYAHTGTALEHAKSLTPDEALRIIAIFRHIIPDATLRICGGRFHVLGERHGQIFAAGANALMTGDYLTTKGQSIADDCRLIASLGLEVN